MRSLVEVHLPLPTMPTIFVLGATGYIGGSVLVGFKQAYPVYDFVALVRNESNFAAVEALGVRVVKGSHSDYAVITEQASKADIILNCANADDLELTKAILAGAKKTTIGKTPILIHTSGTALVTKDADGLNDLSCEVYIDDNINDIRNIPESAPHRKIDLKILEADSAGYVSAYIIAPSAIYGTGHGPVHKISQQIPQMIKLVLVHKRPVFVGEGTNEWNNVFIDDLVDLYVLVTNLALSDLSSTAKVDAYTKFFWGSVGKHRWGDVSRRVARILYDQGRIDTLEPQSLPSKPELAALATNSITFAERGIEIGWKPHGPPLDDTLEETVNMVLAEA